MGRRIVKASIRQHGLAQGVSRYRKTRPCPDFLANIGKIKFTAKP